MATKQDKLAIPLVLPNNCIWDEKNEIYSKKSNVERETLTVVPKALDQLREIKGHVCVVSIAGPCRKGKSYILSKVFDQGEVFPLGHLLDPETMGIWLWVVPEKFKDSTGREFTVVLMDSEGIDAVSSKQSDDHRIFTLSVLLSSIMIYNSAGVPNRSDLEGLDFIFKLSQRIQLHTKQQPTDDQHFYESFPYFVWLLRDVVLNLPTGCKTIKDYFIKSFLNFEAEGNTEKARKTAESILKYFSGFDAFSLPPPALDPKVVTNLNDEKVKSQVNPEFLKQTEDFKAVLHSKLSPKKSINKGEFVTGEALAALIQLFVDALNTPGAIPNVQNAWDTFVQTKCSEVLADAVKVYEQEMTSLVEKKIPCEAVLLRSAHDNTMEKCLAMFRDETFSFSIKSVDKYLQELTEKTDSILTSWLDKNRRETETFCTKLIKELKRTILDPVLARLRSQEGSKMQFSDIIAAYNEIQQKYSSNARGAKDAQASVFMNFHPELQKEMEQNIEVLQQMKDFDKTLAEEKAAKAALEEKKQNIEEEKARIEKEKRDKEREMELLRRKQEEEKARLQELFEERLKEQSEQLTNMIEANFEEQRKDREAALATQNTMEDMIDMMKSSLESREKQIEEQREREEAALVQQRSMEEMIGMMKLSIESKDKEMEEQRKVREAAIAQEIEVMRSSIESRDRVIEEQRALQAKKEKEIEEQIRERDEAALARQASLEQDIEVMRSSIESRDRVIEEQGEDIRVALVDQSNMQNSMAVKIGLLEQEIEDLKGPCHIL